MKSFCGFLLFVILYSVTYEKQESLYQISHNEIQLVPSFQLIQATTGYLQQISAEIFFIQSAVFLGGVQPGSNPTVYAPKLAYNYKQISQLYPEFIDTYYYAQSYLPYVAPDFAISTNAILDNGILSYPNNFVLRLFRGMNSLQYLDQPLIAAETFHKASLLPDAPPIFRHLAAILSAQGGNLYAAVISLQAMLRTEEKEQVRKRYLEELAVFQQAVQVQEAVNSFRKTLGRYPKSLDDLTPEYIETLPTFSSFEMIWDSPQVKMRRSYNSRR